MVDGEWARTSITVWGRSAEPEVHDVPGGTLEQQLLAAEQSLNELAEESRAIPVADFTVRLLCSWQPAGDQRAMTLPEGLIRALAALNGTYWMDVYPAESDQEI